jgi:Tfp pilus assembly protein PilX
MFNRKEDGYILITALLLLLVLTILGFTAVSTSTLDNMLSGNMRLREKNLSSADGAVEISTKVIERVVREDDVRNFANIVTDVNLGTELRTTSFDNTDTETANPDLTFTMDQHNVTVDIDKMYSKYMGGSAIKFAEGRQGAGKGSGTGFYTFYRVNAMSRQAIGSEGVVGSVYRYVPK